MGERTLGRSALLGLGVRGGLAVAAGGIAAAVGAGAAAGSPPSDLDLALARLAVGAELLAAAFYARAIAAKRFGAAETKTLERALFNEQEHLAAISGVLTGAGQVPETADDLDISFPDGTFASRGAIARFGVALETAMLGMYLGAVDAFGPPALKTAAARIAASEAQHASAFTALAANRPVGVSFPAPMGLEAASAFLDGYMS